MKSLVILPLMLLSYSFIQVSNSLDNKKGHNTFFSSYWVDKTDTIPATDDPCIDAYLDNIAGDNYAMKFYNKCDPDYKVTYDVIDNGKIKQIESTVYVKAHSGNTSGTVHCSSEAKIRIIKKESY